MKFDFLNNKDFLGGLLLVAIGVAAALVASDYPQGYPKRMGPGYFPRYLRRALLLSRGDPSVFFTRPISLAFLVATLLVLAIVIAPALRARFWPTP